MAYIFKNPISIIVCFLLSAALVNPSNSRCDDYKVIRIADSISNPELGLFNAALANPVIEGDYVVFRTLNNLNVVANIWSWNLRTRNFTKLVDLSMSVPGGTGKFTDLNAGMGGPVLKDGIVIFGARDSSTPAPPVSNTGIYSVPVIGGAIQRVANYNTTVPGGIGKFFSFGVMSAHTGNYSFSDGIVGIEGEFGGGPIGNRGIYQSSIAGTNMLPIADSLHGIGDLFPIKNFTHVIVNSNRAAFIGGNVFGYSTLFSTQLPASLPNYNHVIKVDTVLPGATGGFSFLLPSVRLLGNSIFFIATDSVSGGTNNRRTLYEIPFAGGTPKKIFSNFDKLEGLPSIELDSVSSYDLNQDNILIRAKAPGTTPQQGLYLHSRQTKAVKRIFTLEQQILDRHFGGINLLMPGSMTSDSSRIALAISGSALFVGPFTYIVLLSNAEADDPVVSNVSNILSSMQTNLPSARKQMPPKPSSSLPKAKRQKINEKRRSINAARKELSSLITLLINEEAANGQSIRAVYSNLSKTNVSKLKKFRKVGSSATTSTEDAKAAWKKFAKTLTLISIK